MMKDLISKYYFDQNYNCAETIIRAANEYYGFQITDNDMRMVAGFGAGMQCGNTCGAIISCISVISMKYVETIAHESKDIRPLCMNLMRKFNAKYNSTLCKDIKPQSFEPEIRCLHTIENACDILEEVFKEYENERLF